MVKNEKKRVFPTFFWKSQNWTFLKCPKIDSLFTFWNEILYFFKIA